MIKLKPREPKFNGLTVITDGYIDINDIDKFIFTVQGIAARLYQ